MTYDFDGDGRFPMFATDPTRGGGVESLLRPVEEPEAGEEEDENPEHADPVKEKTQHG